MKQYRIGLPFVACIVALGGLFLFSLVSFFLLPAQQRHGRVWSGYYLLLIDRRAPCEPLVERLRATGFERVVAQCTATVSLNSFGSLETLLLSRVSTRLDPVDPRIDPYMRGLPAWFQTELDGEPAAIIYLASDENPWVAYRRVAVALAGADLWWRFPEWERLGASLFAAAFALIASVLVVRSRGFRPAALAAALPWPVWIFFGGLPAFSAAVTVYAAAIVALERIGNALRERRRLPLAGATLWLITATAAGLLLYPENGFHGRLPLISGAAGAGAVVFIMLLLRERRYRINEHRLFAPLPMIGSRTWSPGSAVAALPVALLLAIAAPLAYAVLPWRAAPHIPEPEAISGDVRSFDTLQLLSAHNGEGAPPNLADYVAHRAFQEAFMYQREWAVPQRGEELTRRRFAQNAARLERTSEVIVEYTPDWLEQVLRDSSPNGVEAILLAQPWPARVVLRPKSKLYFDRSFLSRHAIMMVVMTLPVLIYAGRNGWVRYRSRSLLQRSSRQHA